MSSRLIVALDIDDIDKAERLIDILSPVVEVFKVGIQLYTACGPEIIRLINKRGAKVFLDLKFYDIPNTVREAVRVAVGLEVFMLNMHIQGGLGMMKAGKDIAESESKRIGVKRPLLLGVTVLTSMGQQDLLDLEIRKGMKSQVLHLARLAQKAGLDGVVASSKEIQPIKWSCGERFLVITPGIRPEWAQDDDQRRTDTPKEAIQKGADYIVVGRPIIKADDPLNAAHKILREMEGKEDDKKTGAGFI